MGMWWGGEYGNAGLLVGFRDLPAGLELWGGACDYATVALSSAGGGVWLQVSCSTGLHHSLPLVDFWCGDGGFLGLCLSSAGGLLEHPTCGPPMHSFP